MKETVQVTREDREAATALWQFMQAQGPAVEAEGGRAIGREMLQAFARHRLSATFAPAGVEATRKAQEWLNIFRERLASFEGDTSGMALAYLGNQAEVAARHVSNLLAAAPAPSGQEVAGKVPKLTTAADVKAAVRAWLDADDATHWGTFETALDAAINETPERALIVAMLRADAATMRANADAYSEEAPTDARALHEVAATLGFKAAQIERGDHLDATTPPASGVTVPEGEVERIAAIIRSCCQFGVRQEPFDGPLDTADLAAREIAALSTPSATPGEVLGYLLRLEGHGEYFRRTSLSKTEIERGWRATPLYATPGEEA